jgi:hypothetical protein
MLVTVSDRAAISRSGPHPNRHSGRGLLAATIKPSVA